MKSSYVKIVSLVVMISCATSLYAKNYSLERIEPIEELEILANERHSDVEFYTNKNFKTLVDHFSGLLITNFTSEKQSNTGYEDHYSIEFDLYNYSNCSASMEVIGENGWLESFYSNSENLALWARSEISGFAI